MMFRSQRDREDNLLTLGAYGKLTLPALSGANHWALIVPLVLLSGGALIWLDRKGW